MTPFSVAGVQMYVSATTSNVSEMRRQLAILVHQFPWVDMVVFSELASRAGFLRSAACECPRGPGRWERENGIHGLGQVLKSFRDRRVEFPVYRSETFDNTYLDGLGPIRKPERRQPPKAAGTQPRPDDLQLPPNACGPTGFEAG